MHAQVTMSTVGHATKPFNLVNHEPWMTDGACVGVENPDIFFPLSEDLDVLAEPAKRICSSCSVQPTCLTWALLTRLPVDEDDLPGRPSGQRRGARIRGIWGGTTYKERAALRKGTVAERS